MKNDNAKNGSGSKRGFVSDSLKDYDPIEGVRPRRFFSDDDDRNYATRDRTLWGQTSWDDPDTDTDPEGELAPDDEWGARISHFGKGPKGYKRSDERIKEEVCEVLARNPRIDASDIEVSVDDALVTLSGTVSSKEIRRAAEMAIENISGIDDVKNELRIKKAAPGPASSTRDSSHLS